MTLLPTDIGLACLQVRPDEAESVNMNVDRKQTLLRLVKALNSIETRSLGKLAIESIAPAVILATEYIGRTALSLYNRESSVATDVVKAVDLALAIFDQEERVARDVEFLKVAGLWESDGMCEEHPFAGEDCSTFELVETLGPVP